VNQDAKDKLTEAGVKAGATLFGRLMDHFAEKRPNGLVARFRKRFGRITPEQIADEVTPLAKKLSNRK
jgi:hypothetical protein